MDKVPRELAVEEAFFLGLRLNCGVDLTSLTRDFGQRAVSDYSGILTDLVSEGLLECTEGHVRLTTRGRLLSNEVFERFISSPPPNNQVS
jgi:oxygen-independent coproporphyrinogen-3 oxidase